MKSTRKTDRSFTWEDFEKGLMLAGYLMPRTVEELNQKHALEEYQKELNHEKAQVYFKRAVLAAEIVSQLHAESTFGRVKFQKLVYLCEHAASMDLQHRYSKLTAGPFDRKFMHSIEQEFEKQHWFKVQKIKEGTITRSKYSPLENCEKYKSYYQSYFKQIEDNIDQVIQLFRNKKTDFTEIAATLYFCYLEIKEAQIELSDSELLERFYKWSESKTKYDEGTVLHVWKWLQNERLVKV